VILLDTSAIVAIADVRDEFHERAIRTMERLSSGDAPLLTHSYVVLETAAVMQRKIGMQPPLDFLTEIET
jgi:predicted nucleic acid-binding protein